MIVVHRVFRRESDLMPTLIQAVPNGDTARAGVLAQAFSDYQLGLHLHHTGEDELVWPLLHGFHRPARSVQANSLSSQDMALMRNGHMDRIGGLVDKPVQFSGGLVAEHGARPRC